MVTAVEGHIHVRDSLGLPNHHALRSAPATRTDPPPTSVIAGPVPAIHPSTPVKGAS